jgi:hypothetical protein
MRAVIGTYFAANASSLIPYLGARQSHSLTLESNKNVLLSSTRWKQTSAILNAWLIDGKNATNYLILVNFLIFSSLC